MCCEGADGNDEVIGLMVIVNGVSAGERKRWGSEPYQTRFEVLSKRYGEIEAHEHKD